MNIYTTTHQHSVYSSPRNFPPSRSLYIYLHVLHWRLLATYSKFHLLSCSEIISPEQGVISLWGLCELRHEPQLAECHRMPIQRNSYEHLWANQTRDAHVLWSYTTIGIHIVVWLLSWFIMFYPNWSRFLESPQPKVTCISPPSAFAEETVNSLNYAQKAPAEWLARGQSRMGWSPTSKMMSQG